MGRDYARILPIQVQEFITLRGTWHAEVDQYPHPPVGARLLHFRIKFKPQPEGQPVRRLDLWIRDATDVTLLAEFVEMMDAINSWLDNADGDDELYYDHDSGELVPSPPSSS